MVNEEEDKTRIKLSNRTYDWLKHLVQVVLPASGAAYFGLAGYWNFPNPDEVVGTIAIVTTFLGVTLKLSEIQYKNDDTRFDGQLIVEEDDIGDKTASLELRGDPEDIISKDIVTFKIGHKSWFPDEHTT